MRAALRGVEYIAQHIKNQDKDNEVSTHSFFACLLIFYKKPKNQPNKWSLIVLSCHKQTNLILETNDTFWPRVHIRGSRSNVGCKNDLLFFISRYCCLFANWFMLDPIIYFAACCTNWSSLVSLVLYLPCFGPVMVSLVFRYLVLVLFCSCYGSCFGPVLTLFWSFFAWI